MRSAGHVLMIMKLRTAFRLLKPQAPTYAALRQARADFQKRHHNNADALALGNTAYSKLLEQDVYWFCDFEKYSQETADMDIMSLYQSRLEAVRQVDSLQVTLSDGTVIVRGTCEEHQDALQRLGFVWRRTKQRWTWKPDDKDKKSVS